MTLFIITSDQIHDFQSLISSCDLSLIVSNAYKNVLDTFVKDALFLGSRNNEEGKCL